MGRSITVKIGRQETRPGVGRGVLPVGLVGCIVAEPFAYVDPGTTLRCRVLVQGGSKLINRRTRVITVDPLDRAGDDTEVGDGYARAHTDCQHPQLCGRPRGLSLDFVCRCHSGCQVKEADREANPSHDRIVHGRVAVGYENDIVSVNGLTGSAVGREGLCC